MFVCYGVVLQIEWAAAVVRELRSTSLLKALVTDDTPSPSSSILEDEDEGGRSSDDPFTQALVFYCSKALDFHETILTNSTPAPCEELGWAWLVWIAVLVHEMVH